MFRPGGLFEQVPCPQSTQCSLLTCVFSHKDNSLPMALKRASTSVEKPNNAIEQPPKRQKVPNSIWPEVKPPSSNTTPSTTKSKAPASNPTKIDTVASPDVDDSLKHPPRKAPKENLNPRMIPKSPAPHSVRTTILNKVHWAMSTMNEKLKKDKNNTNKSLILSENELVIMALDEEERAAKQSLYSNIIRSRVLKLTRMNLKEWAEEVMDHLYKRYYKTKPIQSKINEAPKPIETGLSKSEEIALVKMLITPLAGLEEFGYNTKAPSAAEVETAKETIAYCKGWEKCDRCGGRFQVFPGRREDGALTGGGLCTHHPSRPTYPLRKKTDTVTGSSGPIYPCCNEPVSTSSGCTKANDHVFKISEVKFLSAVLPFETTPTQPDKGSLEPVSFDCEMGYTTLGLELIRLTAVSWPENRELLDILVRPFGEVLDLNSRYSGVFPEHYASARPYGTPIGGEGKPSSLQVVESPAAARDLLFKLLQPDTPLIGHAIENDLNACRIIHPTVIDTVILYPAGPLPSRHKLKFLAYKFLDREIQMGGQQGHDSKEDSIATGDLVRVKVRDIWKRLQNQGWTFVKGELVAPPGQGEEDLKMELHRGRLTKPKSK
ncbi:hypothetical protein N7495_007943 [Penicillium taxi]|uniref:uncharacterized protein n=1 Tax=Penicillium taxi TaxID=168475 RepID=UPI00254588DA|nr:uncharacterized protein N7495_007943 [Penicillium taxi]KAJ5887902.1 hypothetical protein N7495_007943 [Penicillium taxi]